MCQGAAMTVRLRIPTLAECEQQRQWRNDPGTAPMLRSQPLSREQQEDFYHDVIRNPDADHVYYAVEVDGAFAGLGGLTYLSRKSGEAEISLVLGPDFRRKGIGREVVSLLLEKARTLNLSTVIGECYAHGAMDFWQREVNARAGTFGIDDAGSLKWSWPL